MNIRGIFPFTTMVGDTQTVPLADIIQRLSAHEAVEGILLLGSTGKGTLTATSDYDVWVVVFHRPVAVWQVITEVEGRVAEFYIDTVAVLDALASEPGRKAHTDGKEALLARWLSEGAIAFSRNGRLEAARERLKMNLEITMWTHEELYTYWYKINYNQCETRRLLLSHDLEVLMTIDMRLLFGLHEAWVSYFRFRSLAWLGDKEAIRYLRTNDLRFLEVMERCISERDRATKLRLYERLSALSTEPVGGLWPDGDAAAQVGTGPDWRPDSIQEELSFWQKLTGEK